MSVTSSIGEIQVQHNEPKSTEYGLVRVKSTWTRKKRATLSKNKNERLSPAKMWVRYSKSNECIHDQGISYRLQLHASAYGGAPGN